MTDPAPPRRGPGIGSLLGYGFVVFLLVFGAYLAVELVPSEALGGVDRVRIISDKIDTIGREAWTFGKPILQLIVILAILEWVLVRFGVKLNLQSLQLQWDIRAILALLVVAAFSLAALSGGPGMGVLEDVCLVVVGFYFGGLTKGPTQGQRAPEK